jgi:hypothetical protein
MVEMGIRLQAIIMAAVAVAEQLLGVMLPALPLVMVVQEPHVPSIA